eukprot:RCo049039
MSQHEELVVRLFEINAVKFGQFKLKSGLISPIYLDLRVIVSFPDVLSLVAELVWEKAKGLPVELLCGVPYTALPIATVVAVTHRLPMVMRRKEKKDYGTAVSVEGSFRAGQTVLVVEDVITSGASILETNTDLTAAGLRPTHCVVVVDREQGGRATVQ